MTLRHRHRSATGVRALSTERISPRYSDLDLWPTADAVAAILEGQLAAAAAVQAASDAIAEAADAAAARLRKNGRLIYCGAGTSGRLAVLDGVELGPTYDWSRTVYALAGGMDAMLESVEGAEDDTAAAEAAIRKAAPAPADVVIGVAASGRTPFTVAAIGAARTAGALTIGLASNAGTPLLSASDHPIPLLTGPEVVAGSTRMKAGTAQKIALNTLSTAIMLRLGRVHAGLMVEMRLSNAKLQSRAAAIVAQIAETDRATAETALTASGGSIKRAVLIALGRDEAALDEADGNLRNALRRR
ncbi:N-acetylmuramic acid 6-phosphate etherase [Sphingomonas tabacisoli]|uniref:N-acetylmuramic acid 6-phosphate etherase n=1 Tax=Sphingomonas tabacisoli TaxID=2249466 RepID=A0ABW4I2V8_9SPHN